MEGVAIEHSRHEGGFLEARRKEVRSAGLPAQRAVPVRRVVALCRRRNRRGQFRIPGRLRVVERESKAKRRVGVHAVADRVFLARQKLDVLVANQPGQRRQAGFELLTDRVGPGPDLHRELQQPRPAVHAFPAARLVIEIADLAGDVGRVDRRREPGDDGVTPAQVRVLLQQFHEHPVAVHRGMPVVAAVERGMQLGWRQQVLGALQRLAELVGVFLVDAVEGEAREVRGALGGEDEPVRLFGIHLHGISLLGKDLAAR